MIILNNTVFWNVNSYLLLNIIHVIIIIIKIVFKSKFINSVIYKIWMISYHQFEKN